MPEERIICGKNEEEIWQQIAADIFRQDDFFQYEAVLKQGVKNIALDIDIEPGGSFEGGYATTSFIAPLHVTEYFQFALYSQNVLAEPRKVYGMQEVRVGDVAFDKKFIIRTNNKNRAKTIFADEAVRSILQTVDNVVFEIARHHNPDTGEEESYLELNIEEGIIDPDVLRKIYYAFYAVLLSLEPIDF